MNISDLYTIYEDFWNGKEQLFFESQMLPIHNKLEYGFFPIGTGILKNRENTTENRTLNSCRIMVLGNDWGTMDALEDRTKDKREPDSSATIKNLREKLKLNHDETFYSNFFMGVRDNDKYRTITMNSAINRSKDFEKECFDFFERQLNFLRPTIVLCLGLQVGDALAIYGKGTFDKFNLKKKKTLEELYKHNEFSITHGSQTFILVPHPSDWRNWSDTIKMEVEKKLFEKTT